MMPGLVDVMVFLEKVMGLFYFFNVSFILEQNLIRALPQILIFLSAVPAALQHSDLISVAWGRLRVRFTV